VQEPLSPEIDNRVDERFQQGASAGGTHGTGLIVASAVKIEVRWTTSNLLSLSSTRPAGRPAFCHRTSDPIRSTAMPRPNV